MAQKSSQARLLNYVKINYYECDIKIYFLKKYTREKGSKRKKKKDKGVYLRICFSYKFSQLSCPLIIIVGTSSQKSFLRRLRDIM